ncbi:P-loop containing nucleoside triphosphate hydrolase protein [Radiomyces spectabilis]|uniref:P-loop containing nucleoside triphosphate hydrolase protein n=1 Tax=Radiomyces spectabilis TaxID=64574 RepID=UPI00221F7C54|nr:P-loop containing nucleoside triphosphate hydrolase protein [Radiomyces spectabilis]KAI8372879.1 P-loop containing nucleoside triphosphate hydrolase protein [Radiomyces spectabilis]
MVHGRNQVMSSLFTSNPEINLPKFSKKTTQRSDIPSNAPIADSGNFTGIGIDADLVDLLQKKFNVDTPTNVQRRAIPLLLGPSREVLDAAIPDQDVDVVVQAQTGSGKTLTYLLPIINRLVAASTYNPANSGSVAPFGDRSVGTVAIILAPTRELAQQVTGVLTQLVNLPRPKAEGVRRLHWIVPGMVIGGDSKSKEKARLRKGVNVLVSTPGRLLDHLENTKSFDIQNLKWLVLDEADRLLDLGFEETLKKIMTIIDERTRTQGSEKFKPLMKSKYWPKRRQTVLCSATLREDVKSLAGWLLVKPVFVRGMELESTGDSTEATSDEAMEDIKFTAPNQLKQKYTIIPAKLRLVTLVALLKSCFVSRRNKPLSSKVIVFFSCCDSVDFHYDLLANAGKALEDEDEENEEDLEEDDEDHEQTMMKKTLEKIMGKTDMSKNKQIKKKQPKKDDDLEKKKPFQISTLLGEVPVFRLHGDLEQQVRTETFSEFSKASAGVLLCTDVAARGLDLPNVDRIVQYDPPTDMKDYVHRVGRTARLGKAGEAMLFLLPSEMEYLDIIKAQDLYPDPVTVESILEGLVEKHSKQDFQTAAQELQNNMEQYVLSQEENVVMARKAYWSSVRAYATHSAAEKHIFHVRKLHLGHIAKAFGLREAPSNLHEQSKGQKKRQAKQERTPGQHKFGAKGGEVKKNPMKRKYDQADEFAITSADKLVSGPVTKKKKKLAKK